MTPKPSTELAIPTVTDLCQQIIHTMGTDRSTESLRRADADWKQTDWDGSELQLRLIQRRLSSVAHHTLRIETSSDHQRSIYTIHPFLEYAEQITSRSSQQVAPFRWPASVIRHFLHTALSES